MERKRKPAEIIVNVPVMIPVPKSVKQIEDLKEKQKALDACWLSYGYSDRYRLTEITDDHFTMVKK